MAKKRTSSAKKRATKKATAARKRPANYTQPGSIATTGAEVRRRLRLGQVPIVDPETGEPTGRTAYGHDFHKMWPYRPQDTTEIAKSFRAAHASKPKRSSKRKGGQK